LIFLGVDLQDATGLDDPRDQVFCLLLNRLAAGRPTRPGGCWFPADCCRAGNDTWRLPSAACSVRAHSLLVAEDQSRERSRRYAEAIPRAEWRRKALMARQGGHRLAE